MKLIAETAWHHAGDFDFFKTLVESIAVKTEAYYMKFHISIDVDEEFINVVKTIEIGHLTDAMKQLVKAENEIVKLTTAMAQGIWTEKPTERSDKDLLNSSLKTMIENHLNYTALDVAKAALDNWSETVTQFVKVMPTDYKRVLQEMAKEKAVA